MRLANKTAFITGGNSGIGLATARLFVAEGAKVAITGRNKATLDAAAKELGPNALAIVADATDRRHEHHPDGHDVRERLGVVTGTGGHRHETQAELLGGMLDRQPNSGIGGRRRPVAGAVDLDLEPALSRH